MNSWNNLDGSNAPYLSSNPPPAYGTPRSSANQRHPSNLPSHHGHAHPQQSYDRSTLIMPQTVNGTPAFSQKWDPSTLLNPRGYQTTPQSRNTQQSSFLNNGTQNANMAFSFASPGGSSHSSSNGNTQTPPAQDLSQDYTSGGGIGTDFGQVMGMGSMLERRHNVVDRDMVPTKRRKLAHNLEEQGKSTFSGGGKGGVLGQYEKDKREEGRKEVATNGTGPVVLSLDDDDDVQVVVGDREKEVCYGRIEGATINCHQIPKPKDGAVTLHAGFWPQCKIILRRRIGEKHSIIHAIDDTRGTIGNLDINTAAGLAPLLDARFELRAVARILPRPKKDDDLEPGSRCTQRFNLDLNLYGPKKYAAQIGRHLSQKQLWLRTPLFVEATKELHNPHTGQKPPEPPRAIASSSYYGARQQGPIRTTEEVRNDILGMFDSLEAPADLQEMSADPRITTELLKHQKQGLYFMTNKERERVFARDEKGNSSLWRLNISANGQKTYMNVITGQEERQSPPQVLGGILADMMGLGKTLSILSLVMSTLDVESKEWEKQIPSNDNNNRELGPQRKGKTALPQIGQAPLVLNARATLLVCPLSTIANWEEQIKQHIKPGGISYHIYHGSGRIKNPWQLGCYDLVITTYGSIASEFSNRSKGKAGGYPMEEINWFRIVLDEAHMIREQSTQQSKAICRLAANRRWAVTGTPVQNRLDDLGALLSFLRIKPFDEKGGFAQHIMAPFKLCDPEVLPKLRLLVDSITLRRLKDKIDLPARHDNIVRLHFSPEERRIYKIYEQNAEDRVKVIAGQGVQGLSGKSYVHILQSILRLRLICAHGKDLLSEEDLKMMNGVSKDLAIDLSDDDDDDRPALSATQAYVMYNLMKQTNADQCITCHRQLGPMEPNELDGEAKDEVIGHMTPCFHIVCPACIGPYKRDMEDLASGRNTIDCPLCQQHIKLFYFPLKQGGVEDQEESRLKTKNNGSGKGGGVYNGPHTKTKALIADLLASNQESALMPDQPPIKSVVFSGWTSHLDLLQRALEDNKIHYCRLDGKMSRVARSQAMDNFREDPSILVMIVSIMAGGLGLNLTTANKVYVMEPQYNPAAEAQAIDRVHRLGQKREVETVRYIMAESFEEKMLVLQDKKKKLAQLSMDGEGHRGGRIDKAEAARKRLEDLRSLFK